MSSAKALCDLRNAENFHFFSFQRRILVRVPMTHLVSFLAKTTSLPQYTLLGVDYNFQLILGFFFETVKFSTCKNPTEKNNACLQFSLILSLFFTHNMNNFLFIHVNVYDTYLTRRLVVYFILNPSYTYKKITFVWIFGVNYTTYHNHPTQHTQHV